MEVRVLPLEPILKVSQESRPLPLDALEQAARAMLARVRERLGVADEALEVREAAIGFARQLCVAGARADLVKGMLGLLEEVSSGDAVVERVPEHRRIQAFAEPRASMSIRQAVGEPCSEA